MLRLRIFAGSFERTSAPRRAH